MVVRRKNVNVSGTGARKMMFAHGFGCDQNMWREVASSFEKDFRVILFDHVGAGHSDLAAYDYVKYGKLDGDARDVVEVGHALELEDAIFVGHSVSAMSEWVYRAVRNSKYVLLDATGHCPNLSAPQQVTAAIRAFV